MNRKITPRDRFRRCYAIVRVSLRDEYTANIQASTLPRKTKHYMNLAAISHHRRDNIPRYALEFIRSLPPTYDERKAGFLQGALHVLRQRRAARLAGDHTSFMPPGLAVRPNGAHLP